MNLLAQLFGGAKAKQIEAEAGVFTSALNALKSKNYAAFYDALPADVKSGLLNFFISKIGGGLK